MKGGVKERGAKNIVDAFDDPKYICQSCTLITEALQRGGDVMQMPNGDIIVTERKAVTSHYNWNTSKEKLIRSSTKICSK